MFHPIASSPPPRHGGKAAECHWVSISRRLNNNVSIREGMEGEGLGQGKPALWGKVKAITRGKGRFHQQVTTTTWGRGGGHHSHCLPFVWAKGKIGKEGGRGWGKGEGGRQGGRCGAVVSSIPPGSSKKVPVLPKGEGGKGAVGVHVILG